MEIYLYGAGKRGRIIVEMAKKSTINIVGIVDSNKALQSLMVGEFKINAPDFLIGKKDINVCITYYSSMLKDSIWDELSDVYGIEKENIYSFNDIMRIIYKDISIPAKTCNKNARNLFIGDWNMKLGGVESWLRDVMAEVCLRKIPNVYLVTDRNNSDYPKIVSDNIINFSYDNTPQYTKEYIEKGIEFVIENMPCTMIFSRVDELLLAASLVKSKYPCDLKIIMVDHGACDGMTTDIVSYSDSIDYYVAVSNGIKCLLEDRGVNSNRIRVMTCPVLYNKSLKRFSHPIIRIGYAGRLEVFEKRLDILLKLLDELENNRLEYVVNIAGTGAYENNIKEFVKKRNISNKVKLFGQLDRNQMGDFWGNQDIIINVSDNEGRPISNIEAMLYGAVPVVTNTIGSSEDVVDGINGYIVELEDFREMSKKIMFLNNNREIMRAMSIKAKRMMQDKVSMDEHIQLWVELLDVSENGTDCN